ncbi:MAG: hypothetical protein SangKO_020190 [Sandaracinaceae bacterium]
MRALLILSTLGISGSLVGSGASALLAARLLPLDASMAPLPEAAPPTHSHPGVQLGMFGPPAPDPPPPPACEGDECGEPANPCAPSWRLVGAVVDPLHPERSVAALRGPEGAAALRVSQAWSGATLVRLDAREAELELEDAQRCTIIMGEAAARSADPTPTPVAASTDPRVDQLGQGNVRVAPELLDEVMRSPLRVIPAPSGGFRVFGVRRGSWSGALGLENGDTVQALDGAPIDSPDEALAAYGRLRAGERVSVTLNRRGETMQRTVQLRPE